MIAANELDTKVTSDLLYRACYLKENYLMSSNLDLLFFVGIVSYPTVKLADKQHFFKHAVFQISRTAISH